MQLKMYTGQYENNSKTILHVAIVLAVSDHVVYAANLKYMATFQCPEQATARVPPLVWNHNMAQKAIAYARWPVHCADQCTTRNSSGL